MDKKQLITLIVVSVVLFLLGGALGVLLQGQMGPQKTKVAAVQSLSSKAISSVVAYGQVDSINGRDITLSNLGDSLTVSLLDNAQVYSFTTQKGSTAPVQQTLKFENIKVGDKVNVAVKLLPTGQMQGSSVIILPQAAAK